MSDALSEISRDQVRANAFQKYLMTLCDWVESGYDDTLRQLIVDAANDTDRVRGGFWGNPTNLAARIEERLDQLKEGDPKQWAKLLWMSDDDWNILLKQRLHAASPFREGYIAYADYGYGFVRLHGDFNHALSKAIEAKGKTTNKGETHLVMLPKDVFDRIEVVTIKGRRE